MPWLLLKKSCKWSVVNVGQIKHAHKKHAGAQRHSCRVRSFGNVFVTCATICGQHWMKTVIVEMTIVLKRLVTMALQTNNKDKLIYMMLLDSLIYKFVTECVLKHVLFLFLIALCGLLGCYWEILRNWIIIVSSKAAYYCYKLSHITETVHFKVLVLL